MLAKLRGHTASVCCVKVAEEEQLAFTSSEVSYVIITNITMASILNNELDRLVAKLISK